MAVVTCWPWDVLDSSYIAAATLLAPPASTIWLQRRADMHTPALHSRPPWLPLQAGHHPQHAGQARLPAHLGARKGPRPRSRLLRPAARSQL